MWKFMDLVGVVDGDLWIYLDLVKRLVCELEWGEIRFI